MWIDACGAFPPVDNGIDGDWNFLPDAITDILVATGTVDTDNTLSVSVEHVAVKDEVSTFDDVTELGSISGSSSFEKPGIFASSKQIKSAHKISLKEKLNRISTCQTSITKRNTNQFY